MNKSRKTSLWSVQRYLMRNIHRGCRGHVVIGWRYTIPMSSTPNAQPVVAPPGAPPAADPPVRSIKNTSSPPPRHVRVLEKLGAHDLPGGYSEVIRRLIDEKEGRLSRAIA